MLWTIFIILLVLGLIRAIADTTYAIYNSSDDWATDEDSLESE